jgi:D-proline reductase (dithiol) PrdB
VANHGLGAFPFNRLCDSLVDSTLIRAVVVLLRLSEEKESVAFEYLPIMARFGAPKPPRVLAAPSNPAWYPIKKPLSESRVALLSSAALRLVDQEPFIPREDRTYRLVPSDPSAGEIVIDHHSGIGRVPHQDPEIVFPRSALAALANRGVIGALSPFHISFMGGLKCHKEIESEIAPAIAAELKRAEVDVALLVPY